MNRNQRLGWLAASLVTLLFSSAGGARSNPSARAAAVASGCSTDSTLCLSEGRFLIDATWTKPDGESGIAHAVALTADSGYFWFLAPGNVELAVKTLNGCSTNHHYWFFAGGLTNLALTIRVTDTTTNAIKTYSNPQGQAFHPVADTAAFSSCPAVSESLGDPEEPAEEFSAAMPVLPRAAPAAQGCATTDSVLCIDGRYTVQASWRTASGKTGTAHALDLGSESGYFWFFDPENVEVIVKALNACGLGRGNWFFAAGMTTVGVHLEVTDTFTGAVRAYDSFAGSPFAPIQDTRAFPFCPTPSPTPTSTPTLTSPTPTPTPTNPPRPATTHVATASWGHRCDFICDPPFFSPGQIHIRVGDSVKWTWRHGQHSVTSGGCDRQRANCVPNGLWNSGAHTEPFVFVRTFNRAGVFPFYCIVGHPAFPGPHTVHETGMVIVSP